MENLSVNAIKGVNLMELEIITPETGVLKALIDIKINPQTANSILHALPIVGSVRRWGNELYFSTPIQIAPENGQEIMEIGDLAFWPSGQAICIFFGPTPVSTDQKPRAASSVNRFGRLLTTPASLSNVPEGARIEIRKL